MRLSNQVTRAVRLLAGATLMEIRLEAVAEDAAFGKPYRWHIALLMGIGMVVSLMDVGLPQVTRFLIDAVADGRHGDGAPPGVSVCGRSW